MAIPTLAVAGMEIMVARMARKLVGRGHQVGITCIEAGGPLVPELTANGVRVSVVEAHGFVSLSWLGPLSRHFRYVLPDVLHIHSGCWLKSVLSGRRAGINGVIHTEHGFVSDSGWERNWLDRAAAPLTSRIVAVSGHLKADLVARGIPAHKISVISNGIDTNVFYPRPATGLLRQKLGIAPSACIVGTVARLEAIKNQAMLIRAIALARQSGCDCEGVLVGDGSLRTDLEENARDLGIADRVHFWGVESDIPAIYPEFDLFALTSKMEGTSVSLLEAMASGVCPLATAVGGNVELLDEGDCGVLTPSDQPAEMARAICEFARNSDRKRSMGQKARARVESCFSENVMVEKYERLYRSCLKSPLDEAQMRTGVS